MCRSLTSRPFRPKRQKRRYQSKGRMRKRLSFITVGIIMALALMGTCAPTSALASAASRAGIGSAKPATWVPGNCDGGSPPWAQHPSRIYATCDGTAVIESLRWRGWDDATAQATGILDDAVSCTPNCAEAPRRHYAVELVASDIGYCGTRRVYGEIVVHYTEPKLRRRKPSTQPTYWFRPRIRPSGRLVAQRRNPRHRTRRNSTHGRRGLYHVRRARPAADGGLLRWAWG